MEIRDVTCTMVSRADPEFFIWRGGGGRDLNFFKKNYFANPRKENRKETCNYVTRGAPKFFFWGGGGGLTGNLTLNML